MPFNERSSLDTSQVEDRRGRRMGTGAAIGGGGLGLVVLLVALLLGVNPGDLGDIAGQGTAAPTEYTTGVDSLAEDCRTGADANLREDCRVVGFVNSIQAYWADEFSGRGAQYVPAKTQLFTDSTQAACGYATAAVGPFYCPADQKVYLDLSFFKELQARFGAKGSSPRACPSPSSRYTRISIAPGRDHVQASEAAEGHDPNSLIVKGRSMLGRVIATSWGPT